MNTSDIPKIASIITQYPEILKKPVFTAENGQEFFADRYVFSYEAFKLLVEKGCNITKDMLQDAIPYFIKFSNDYPAATQEETKEAKAALNYIAEQYNLELPEIEEPAPDWFDSKQYIKTLANDLMKQLAARDLLDKPLPQFTEQHPDHTILDIPEAAFTDHQHPASAIPDTPVGSVANTEFDDAIILL